MRGAVFSDLSRQPESIAAFDEAFSLYEPDNKDIYFVYASLLYTDDQDVKAANIITRVFTNYPESIKTIKYEWLWRISGVIFRAEEFDSYNALIKATAQAQLKHIDDVDETDWVFEAALPVFVRTGDAEGATQFLEYLKSPSQIRDILIDKEMEPIWPEVEKLAGEGLAQAIDNYVAETKEKAKAENADFKTQHNYLSALRQSGDYEAAISYAKEVLENQARVDAVGMDAYWFISSYASILFDIGDIEAADKVFTDLLETRLPNEPKLVSLAINHVSFLVAAGSFDKALTLIEKYEDNDDFQASDFGWMFMHLNRACSMAETGDIDAARKLYAEKTNEIYKDGLAQHFLAQICLGDDEAAAKTLIARLESERFRDGTLPIFSRASREFKNPDRYHTLRMAEVRRIASRDDVQAVLERFGRSIEIDGPAEYWTEW